MNQAEKERLARVGKTFNAKKYIEKNEIDDVLILGDAQFFIQTFGLSGY